MFRVAFLLWLLFGLNNIIRGQAIDTIYPGLDFISAIQKSSDSAFLALTNSGKLSLINDKGKVLWEKYLTDSSGYSLSPVSVFNAYNGQQDSFFYVTALSSHCDYWNGSWLFKIDFQGNITRLNEINIDNFSLLPIEGRSAFPDISGLPQLLLRTSFPEKLFAYYSPDSIELISEFNRIFAVGIDELGGFVVVTKDSLKYFQPTSSGFSFVRQVVLPKQIHYGLSAFIATDDDSYLLVNDDKVYKYNYDLTDSKSFSTQNDDIVKQILYYNKIIYAVAVSSAGENIIYGLKEDLSLIFRKKAFLTNAYISDLAIIYDSIMVVAGVEAYNDNNGFIFLKSLQDSIEFIQTGFDIGISDIKYESFSISDSHDCLTEILQATQLSNASIELVNNGNATVDDILVTPRKAACFPFCAPIYLWNAQLTDLDLLPGEKKWVHVGEIILYNIFEDSDSLCLIVTQPDRHVDINHADNEVCIARTVGISDHNGHNDFIVFYPNPVSDELYYSTDKIIRKIVIYDLNGKILKVNNAIERSLDVEQLVNGMYVIQFEIDNGYIISHKFVKK